MTDALLTVEDLMDQTEVFSDLPILKREERVYVSPEQAAEWLTKNKDNRPLRKNKVKQIVKALKEGKFLYNQFNALCFFKDGNLADGQHRCCGVRDSGKGAFFDIIRGIEDERHIAMIDAITQRKAFDYAVMAKMDVDNSKFLNAARTMHLGYVEPKGQLETDTEIWKLHKDAVLFAQNNLNAFKYDRYEFLAAVGRAYEQFKDLDEKLKRLEQFLEVFQTGKSGGYAYPTPALSWRNAVLTCPKPLLNRQASRDKIFKITMHAINSFVANKDDQYDVKWLEKDNRKIELLFGPTR